MYSIPNLEPVCCSISRPNRCFLTCIQISYLVSQVVWHSHLLRNFPQFVVIDTVRGFGVVNKAEVNIFLELSRFFVVVDLTDVGNLISGSSAFSKSSLNIWKFMFTYCWSQAWRILSITLLVCEISAIVWQFEHSLALPFLETGMKTDLFLDCGHCWVFQICWHIECSSFTASSFRIFKSSNGILSPPLALFVVMLPKTHLTLLPGCLALGEWSHHRDYLGHEDLFCIALLCILVTSS